MRLLAKMVVVACVAWSSMAAQAQDWPVKPIRFILPTTPGGAADLTARVIAEKLTASLGQSVYVDSRPGAGGNIGVDLAAKSAPDGYTMVLGTIGPIAINPSLYEKLPYNPLNDLVPVTQAVNTLNVLVVNAALPVNSVSELIAYAKAHPGQLNFASTGPGQTDHLAGELFNTLAGVKLVHVPYKGGPAAMQDLLAGNVQVMFATVASAIGQIKSGKVRAIALTGAKRTSLLPDVPTIAESGLPEYVVNNWYGVFVPAGTSKEIVARLNADIGKALDAPDSKERLLQSGIEVAPSSPDAFARYVQSETQKWAKVVKDAGAKVD